MAEEIAKYEGANNVQDFDGYFDKVKRYPTPAGARRGYVPMTDGNGQMILHSMTAPGSESEANANIAPLEAGPTASQAYAVGDLMVYQGQLMTVVQAIAEGGAITPGTNVMSYTVAQALMSKVPVYGMGKNLLRNAYFVGGGSQQGGQQFPINQRGQTSYTGAGYGIDGWQSVKSDVTITLTVDGLSINRPSGDAWTILQKFEQLPSGPVTASALISNVLHSFTFANGFDNSSQTDGVVYFWANSTDKSLLFGQVAPSLTSLQAIKLELGPVQTLAHLENGTWVLNEVPDYEEELIKCQTSKADASDSYANKTLATQQQLATVETTSTASRAYAVGEYLCYNWLLYRVTVAISAGGTITPGTNVMSYTVAQALIDIVIDSKSYIDKAINMSNYTWVSGPGFYRVGIAMNSLFGQSVRYTIVSQYSGIPVLTMLDGDNVTLVALASTSPTGVIIVRGFP